MLGLSDIKDAAPRWMKDAGDLVTRSYAKGTVGARPTPDFLIVGAKRGGTTSLYNYLLMHPGVLGLFPQVRGKKSTDYFFKERGRGELWYRSHFHTESYRNLLSRKLGYRPISGEASPYYLWDPRIAMQVRAVAPDIKAIALLRDPVERAYSHYQERVQNGVEPLSFEAALAAEDARLEGEFGKMAADSRYYSTAHDFYTYRARGVYLPQLQNWHRAFPEGQLLVLRSEDMYDDVQGVFNRVCDFLGIPPYGLPTTKTFNASARSTMPEAAREELTSYYAPHNKELADYLQRDPLWA
jgi:hypothetical protein